MGKEHRKNMRMHKFYVFMNMINRLRILSSYAEVDNMYNILTDIESTIEDAWKAKKAAKQYAKQVIADRNLYWLME